MAIFTLNDDVDFRSHIVGVHARGWDVPMWELSTEQAADFDQFQWLFAPDTYERVLRGCATNCAGGLATLRTQQARVLAITHLHEFQKPILRFRPRPIRRCIVTREPMNT